MPRSARQDGVKPHRHRADQPERCHHHQHLAPPLLRPLPPFAAPSTVAPAAPRLLVDRFVIRRKPSIRLRVHLRVFDRCDFQAPPEGRKLTQSGNRRPPQSTGAVRRQNASNRRPTSTSPEFPILVPDEGTDAARSSARIAQCADSARSLVTGAATSLLGNEITTHPILVRGGGLE